MTVIAQHAATDAYAVRVVRALINPSMGCNIQAQVIDRKGKIICAMVTGHDSEKAIAAARARANNAWTNLYTLGISPVNNTHMIFTPVCAWCHKAGTSGRPLLNGRNGLRVHDTCDN